MIFTSREAFDHAEGLFLLKAVLSIVARDERVVERILGNARADATRGLKTRVGASEQLQERAQRDLQAVEQQKAKLQELLHEERRTLEYKRARNDWAIKQLVSQGMLGGSPSRLAPGVSPAESPTGAEDRPMTSLVVAI